MHMALFHASLNLFSPGDLDARRQEIVEVLVYGASAIILIAVSGRHVDAGHPRATRLSLDVALHPQACAHDSFFRS
jgi:hypothetical protein